MPGRNELPLRSRAMRLSRSSCLTDLRCQPAARRSLRVRAWVIERFLGHYATVTGDCQPPRALRAITAGGLTMDQGRVVLAGALVVAVAALAVLLLAVGRRWFARYGHGFLLSVVLALAGTGLAIAGVLGVWAYT